MGKGRKDTDENAWHSRPRLCIPLGTVEGACATFFKRELD